MSGAGSAVAVEDVRTVAIIGTGVIGGGWATHFLRMGYDVVAWDPGTGAGDRLRALVDTAWPAMIRLGLREGAARARLSFVDSMPAALEQAHFVQESAPEVLESKVALLADIDAATPDGVVIASSTSGFGMTEMATAVTHADRFVVGHPFNPPYLIPLVEIVGGEGTSPWAVEWAEQFYTRADKFCLTMDAEVPGFVGNRLQEALWREALHMIDAGQATTQQIDDAITYGPGLRWAQMGPMLTYHLGGGPGGMAHLLDQFGPALLEPWTRLIAPELTQQLRDRVVAGAEQEAGGRSVAELERIRNDFLVDLILLRQKYDALLRQDRDAHG